MPDHDQNEEAGLSARLAGIMTAVIEYHVATGKPVGSRFLCQNFGFKVSASTVRSELARLEAMGFLNPSPHLRRPPAYRQGLPFLCGYLRAGETKTPCAADPGPGQLEGEIEDVLRRSAEILARATGLLALVSAPSQDNTAIRHVEVLQLHPEMVVVVIITASGGIAKKLVIFEHEVDPGLVNWARSYLNEAMVGLELGKPKADAATGGCGSFHGRAILSGRRFFGLCRRLSAPGAYMSTGASSFFSRLEADGSPALGSMMELLDRQDEIVKLLGAAISERQVYLLIGREMPAAAMRGCSLVAANYGVAHRNLGTVGSWGRPAWIIPRSSAASNTRPAR